jgi:hypothetical protein
MNGLRCTYTQWSHKEECNCVIHKLMDITGEPHVRLSKPGSERESLCVFSHRWKMDSKDKNK